MGSWRLLSFFALVLASCPAPIAGQCTAAPGSLCITVRDDEALAPPLGLVLEVRVGATCGVLPKLRCETDPSPSPVPGCAVRCLKGEAPERLLSERLFTAEIDLSGHPGPGQIVARLSKDGACVAQDESGWDGDVAPAERTLQLRAAGCPMKPPPRQCEQHSTCADKGEICVNKTCQPPPALAQACPPGKGQAMAYMPPGSYSMGDATGSNEVEQEKVCSGKTITLSKGLCIDIYEATVKEYRSCAGCAAPTVADQTKCTYHGGAALEGRAMNCLSREQAQAYCASQGKRLPTEAEWEWFAGGEEKRQWPWGDGIPNGICAYANGSSCLTGMMLRDRVLGPVELEQKADVPPGVTWPRPAVRGLAGNVSEWVQDVTGVACPGMPMDLSCWHKVCDVINNGHTAFDTGFSEWRIHRGGSFGDLSPSLRTFSRFRSKMGADQLDLPYTGVRCVMDALK